MNKTLLLCASLLMGLNLAPALAETYSIVLNKYALAVVDDVTVYQHMVRHDPKKEMVDLATAIPGIRLEIVYATDKHFVKKKMYTQPKAYLRKVAAQALTKVQAELKTKGLSLKIWDAYRPFAVTEMMWELIRDDRYVADPSHGSKHNRGCAVDLTIVDAKTGKELKMPTPYLDFTAKAHHATTSFSKEVLANRALLRKTMEKHGFLAYNEEWWHYNFAEWGNYELMDISFEQLQGLEAPGS
ncbi:MAG: D-alanyl-D-alanine dipeptidase [Candidatus Melainabacteria bacterium HGW-Melainabacteria-1]|nr:MAG: D-alanyl-D-alanine dipeptidase [Candidatus Melainabacteria bacterium HGW-Melainabacteria-1]